MNSMTASTESARQKRRKRIWIGLSAALIVVVVVSVALGICLSNKKDRMCAVIKKDSERLDCHPDRPISKASCEKRGCCFRPASDLDVTDTDLIKYRFLGVPSCFFPKDYIGHKWTFMIYSRNDVTAWFDRKGISGFPEDVERIQLDMKYIDEHRLRIQIKDNIEKRYEPDVPVSYTEQREADKTAYSLRYDQDTGFAHVTRTSSNQIVFSANMKTLIFSEHFIQISTTVASKYVYGLGDQKEALLKSNFNWQRYTLFNQGDLPVRNRNLYGSHPFFLVMDPRNGESYGIFLLNSNAIDYVLQPTPAITFRTVGGILSFFIFLGPTPGDVVSQYTDLFGRTNFPPRWSLGFHLCKKGYSSLDETVKVLNRNLDAGIPIDAQWHNVDYMQRRLDFTYDPVNFKGLPEFVENLHKDGRHYVAVISPGVSNAEKPGTYSAYDEAERWDIFVTNGYTGKPIQGKVWNDNYTVFLDFSNPDTSNYWTRQFEAFHSKLNFDGVWLDMNEPMNFFNGSVPGEECHKSSYDDIPYVPGRPYALKTLSLCMSALHKNALHYNEHNLVAYREAKATHEAMSKITKKRPFIISRASFSGQGVYSGHWSGDITSDWEDMRYSISAMLAFSLYGMPMTGSDICGFRMNTTEELCARWHSLGAFYPLSRNNNDHDTIDQDPAAMGPKVIEAAKKALAIRYYLIPYLYTLFFRNYLYGETVARPLFFEFPNDEKTYSIEDQFLWGPALHIMPALHKGIVSINPYIPAGVWYNLKGEFFTSRGQHMKFDAELTDINVLLRGGYILPAQVPGKTTVDSAMNPFDLLVALDNRTKAVGELFWDDGEGLDTHGYRWYSNITMSADKNTLKVITQRKNPLGAKTIPLRYIKVYGLIKKPTEVTINSTVLKEDDYTLEEQLLCIQATGFSLLDNIIVTWT